MISVSGASTLPNVDQWTACIPATFSCSTHCGGKFMSTSSFTLSPAQPHVLQLARRRTEAPARCLPLQVRVLCKQIVDAAPGADLSDDHADSDPQSADACLPTHDFRSLSDPI